MNTPHYTKIHNRFQLKGYYFSANELKDIGYDFIKEGVPYEVAIGKFIMDWMDKEDFINVKTSGSTGDPKIIQISKQAMVNSAIRTGDFFNVEIGDTALHCLPADFIAGKMMLIRAMILGLSLDLVQPTADPMKDVISSYDFVAMTPMQAHNSLGRLHQIKTLIIGGAPIYPELNEKLVALHNNCFETYGMTETITHIAASKLSVPKKPFRALDGIHLEVRKNGCLVVDAPDITDQLIHTNDLVEMHDERTFTYLGRRDNVINSGGVKISPEVAERKLAHHIRFPFFLHGIPDEVLGQKLIMVVEASEVQAKDVEQQLAACDSLEKFEVPKTLFCVSEILRNNGKYLRAKTVDTLTIT
ncbi:MAG: AMP-binding protein [Flavobacteriaceae bacterium]|jgi:O-succinylbenzoic acid--CoA ligase|nr:AMP-binding protein [Flavobacteriaceae bacterium]MBT6127956.1 AMP-binding protein [Flavobacteriaceae bacterium]